jgi:hypothetical protein
LFPVAITRLIVFQRSETVKKWDQRYGIGLQPAVPRTEPPLRQQLSTVTKEDARGEGQQKIGTTNHELNAGDEEDIDDSGRWLRNQ